MSKLNNQKTELVPIRALINTDKVRYIRVAVVDGKAEAQHLKDIEKKYPPKRI